MSFFPQAWSMHHRGTSEWNLVLLEWNPAPCISSTCYHADCFKCWSLIFLQTNIVFLIYVLLQKAPLHGGAALPWTVAWPPQATDWTRSSPRSGALCPRSPFNPVLSGAPPLTITSHAQLRLLSIPKLGVDFDPFLWSLLDCICLSHFQLSEKKLQSICDPFGKETLCEWNLRCELNSNSRVFLVKTTVKQCPAGL